MSGALAERVRTGYRGSQAFRTRAVRIVFGDTGGLFVFLLALCAFALVWRTTVTINDNYTVINGLVALADGHLHVTEAVYGDGLGSPGMVRVDGRAYPRNVAHIALALPFLWAAKGVAAVADLRIALAGGWSVLLLATCIVGGRLADIERTGRVGGSVAALGLFGVNAAVATPLSPDRLALVALQFATMVAGAALCLLLYRLLSRMHGQVLGLAAGVATALASPTLFWASVPKRHVLTATLAVASIYLFYRSREAESADATRYRLLAYVPGGLTAWLNAAEGLILLLAIGVVDLLTARRTDLRTLGGIAAVGLLSLVPFFATNELIAGNPFDPPRTLPDYDTGGQPQLFSESADGGNGGGGSGGGGSGTGDGGGGIRAIGAILLSLVPNPVLDVLTLFEFLRLSVRSAVHHPERFVHTFVRSGYVDYGSRGATGLAINIAFLESLPVAGALVAAPRLLSRKLVDQRTDPAVATDLLAASYGLLVTLLYVHRFPIHAMITVRYVFPLFPLAIYGICRLPWVRAAVEVRGSLLAWTYASGVLVGGQLLVVAVHLLGATPDEAIQGSALLALGVAATLAGWSLASAFGRRANGVGAVLLGLSGAVATNTMLVVAYHYFGTDFALPLIPVY